MLNFLYLFWSHGAYIYYAYASWIGEHTCTHTSNRSCDRVGGKGCTLSKAGHTFGYLLHKDCGLLHLLPGWTLSKINTACPIQCPVFWHGHSLIHSVLWILCQRKHFFFFLFWLWALYWLLFLFWRKVYSACVIEMSSKWQMDVLSDSFCRQCVCVCLWLMGWKKKKSCNERWSLAALTFWINCTGKSWFPMTSIYWI